MNNSDKVIVKQSKLNNLFLLFPISIVVTVDFLDNYKILESTDSIFFYCFVITIIYLFHSIFFNKIVLSDECLIIKYPFISSWRNRRYLISKIKSITIIEKVRYPSLEIEINDNNIVKINSFAIAGFNLSSFNSLYDELRNHPNNNMDLNIE